MSIRVSKPPNRELLTTTKAILGTARNNIDLKYKYCIYAFHLVWILRSDAWLSSIYKHLQEVEMICYLWYKNSGKICFNYRRGRNVSNSQKVSDYLSDKWRELTRTTMSKLPKNGLWQSWPLCDCNWFESIISGWM